MTKSRLFIIFTLFVLGLLGSYRLFRPGLLSLQDDMHVFRLEQYHQCLLDLQIPCRFVPDAGLGYGYPLFNYYSPLVYFFGEIFHLLGFSYIDSLKLVLIFTSFLRPIGIFLLSSLFFTSTGGLISAVVFSLAPYQATNSYVRGAISENLALTLIPYILYFYYQQRYRLLTISFLALILCHHLTLLYFIPLFGIFVYLYPPKKTASTLFSLLLASAMSAFFIIPAIVEKNLVHTETMTQGYFNYINHFVTLKQLFLDRQWGYGASLWGPIDDMSFQIGIIQWTLPLLTIILLVFSFRRIASKQHRLVIAFFLLGLTAIFLTHNKSTFIWQSLPFLAYYQFPWRFLGLAIFCFSFISGNLHHFVFRLPNFFVIILLTITTVLNIGYFREDLWFPNLTDSQKLSPENIISQSGAGLKDYWPKSGSNFPTQYSFDKINILSGSATVLNSSKSSHAYTASLDVYQPSTFKLPLVYFPQWQLLVDNQPAQFDIDPDLGLIRVQLPFGLHHLQLDFKNTPIRTFSNYLSIFAIILYISSFFRVKK